MLLNNYNNSANNRKIFWAKAHIHLVILFMIFIGPELIFSIGRDIPTIMLLTPLCYIILFYLNYYWITDKFFYNKKKTWYFIINILLVLVIVAIFYIVETSPLPPIEAGDLPPTIKPDGILPPNMGPGPGPKPEPGPGHGAPHVKHMVRALTMIPRIGCTALLSICLSFIIKSIERLVSMERKQQYLEREIKEVELKNLKNQLNPHFLFNTLNNIYALIPISSDKAQK